MRIAWLADHLVTVVLLHAAMLPTLDDLVPKGVKAILPLLSSCSCPTKTGLLARLVDVYVPSVRLWQPRCFWNPYVYVMCNRTWQPETCAACADSACAVQKPLM
jgi:hypothetical protein